MKQLIITGLLFSAIAVNAQATKDSSHSSQEPIRLQPINTAPANNINIAPGINTTVTNPTPSSNTSNNTNPITGTIIGRSKSKETSTAVDPLGTASLKTGSTGSTKDTTVKTVKKSSPHKRKRPH